jgi:hypothetical protein
MHHCRLGISGLFYSRMDPARPFKPDRNYFSQATFNLDFQSPQMTTDYRLLNFDPDIKSDLATDKSSYVISHHGHWTPQDMEEPIPLAPDLSRGIYPLILLLTSITEGKLMDFRTTRGDDTLPDDGGTDEELFSAFVNKISLFLCTKPGPDTISSCIVLRNDSGQVHYAVASNQRSEAELKSVGAQMVTILEFFSLEAVSKEDALSLVLSVVCRRAVSYAKKLYKSLKGKEGSAGCIRICAQYSPGVYFLSDLRKFSSLNLD